MAPHRWDDEARSRLLVNILNLADVKITRAMCDKLAEMQGDGYTSESIKIYINRKLKKSSNAGTATPRKGGANGAQSSPSKKGKNGCVGSDASDDEETPSRKRVSPRKRSAKRYTEPKTPEDTEEEEPESPTKKARVKVEQGDVGYGSAFQEEEDELQV